MLFYFKQFIALNSSLLHSNRFQTFWKKYSLEWKFIQLEHWNVVSKTRHVFTKLVKIVRALGRGSWRKFKLIVKVGNNLWKWNAVCTCSRFCVYMRKAEIFEPLCVALAVGITCFMFACQEGILIISTFHCVIYITYNRCHLRNLLINLLKPNGSYMYQLL
jgi:hypothetical protein